YWDYPAHPLLANAEHFADILSLHAGGEQLQHDQPLNLVELLNDWVSVLSAWLLGHVSFLEINDLPTNKVDLS
ncbi:MAG TPA: hypothetical protein VNV40_04670, partial [Steroidobacteraceae bacterium]|nr:hypothetical protein [Steroidobacteraceae bacterium]